MLFCLNRYGDHRDLHVLAHAFPTRRSSVLLVGAGCALALAGLDLDVTLVEAAGPAHWSPSHPDLRVFAFAPDNAALLDSFGIWREVLDARAQPYRRMRVWDAAGGGELAFAAEDRKSTRLNPSH